MNETPDGIRSRLERLPDDEVRRYKTLGGDGLSHNVAIAILAEREAERAQANARAEEDRSTHLNLTERGVVATEKQATYAKRAYDRSNVALWLSGIAIIVTAVFALLDFLKG